jgi:hypothetical protein
VIVAADRVADLYADDAILYTPLGRFEGAAAIAAERAEFERGFPGARTAVHDHVASADGTRECLRVRLSWSNTGPFRGRPPTGRSGTAAETHVLTLRDGLIAEDIVGVSTFDLAQLYLVDLGLDFPRDTPDPSPVLVSASAEAASDTVGS